MGTEPLNPGEMEGRVGRLEALTGESRQDMREIRADLKAIIGRLGSMPTKADLETWKWQLVLASVALYAVVVGSIVGGLAWLDPH